MLVRFVSSEPRRESPKNSVFKLWLHRSLAWERYWTNQGASGAGEIETALTSLSRMGGSGGAELVCSLRAAWRNPSPGPVPAVRLTTPQGSELPWEVWLVVNSWYPRQLPAMGALAKGWACLGVTADGPRDRGPPAAAAPVLRPRRAALPGEGVTLTPHPSREFLSGEVAPTLQPAQPQLTCRDMTAAPDSPGTPDAGFPRPDAPPLLKGKPASARQLPLAALPCPPSFHWSLVREGGARR